MNARSYARYEGSIKYERTERDSRVVLMRSYYAAEFRHVPEPLYESASLSTLPLLVAHPGPALSDNNRIRLL